MGTPFENFVNLELPRRPALLTLEITTYDDDPNLGGAPTMLQIAPKGTFFLQDTGAVLWRKETATPGTWSIVGAGGGTDTAANIGTAEPGAAGVYATKVGSEFQFKSLVPGTGVTLTPDVGGNFITIDATGAGGGEVNTASNLGATVGREGLFYSKVGVDLRFKSIVAGANITMDVTNDEITLNSTGGVVPVVGHLTIADVVPTGAGVVSDQVYVDPGHTIIESCTSSTASVSVYIRSSYPNVIVEGVAASLPLVNGVYYGPVAITLADLVINAEIDVVNGASSTCDVLYDSPPQLLSLEFTGTYPGTQTELKLGDVISITGTTDKACTGIRMSDFGACGAQDVAFASTTNFTTSVTIANRGTVAQLLAARGSAKSVAGAYGPTRDTDQGGGSTELQHVVKLNNLYPTVTWGAITYPATQGALKNVESATVAVLLSDLDTVLFSSPNGDLSVTNTTLIETPKTVTRAAGNYNISTNNLRGVATRAANAATTTADTIVRIAHTAAAISVTEPAARLRSGGNNGTAAQNHTITITSTQQLAEAPTMSADVGGGTLQGVAWVGGPTVYTRSLQVHDNDVKGTYNWNTLTATNLAGIVTNAITGDATYVLGGFVQRTVTFPAFTATAPLGVAVITYAKLQAGTFQATGQPALKMAVQGDTTTTVGYYTVSALNVNPTTIFWNDALAVSSNTSTADLYLVEETV